MTQPNNTPSGSGVKKWWRVGAIALLASMVLGKVFHSAIVKNDYMVVPVSDRQADDGRPLPYKVIDDRFSTSDRDIVQAESYYIPCNESQWEHLTQAKNSGTRIMRKQQYETAVQFFEEA